MICTCYEKAFVFNGSSYNLRRRMLQKKLSKYSLKSFHLVLYYRASTLHIFICQSSLSKHLPFNAVERFCKIKLNLFFWWKMNFRKGASLRFLSAAILLRSTKEHTRKGAQKMLKKASFMLKKQLKHLKTNGVIKQGKGGRVNNLERPILRSDKVNF